MRTFDSRHLEFGFGELVDILYLTSTASEGFDISVRLSQSFLLTKGRDYFRQRHPPGQAFRSGLRNKYSYCEMERLSSQYIKLFEPDAQN